MKTSFLTSILLSSVFAVYAADIRAVGQTKVDLQPIHDWKAVKAASSTNTKEAKELGERPLKHWKDLAVVDYVKSLGNPVVVVKLDDGPTNTIMLKNCPPPLIAKFIRQQSLVRQLKTVSIVAANAEGNAEAKDNQHKAAARHARYAEFGSPADIDNTIKFWASHDAQEFVSESKKNVAAIKEEIEMLNAAIKSEANLLAMPTGQSYATFPIWDTGLTTR